MLNNNFSAISPDKYYGLIAIMQSVDDDIITKLVIFKDSILKAAELIQNQAAILAKANNDMQQEMRASVRVNSNRFDSLEKQSSDYNNIIEKISDVNFLLVAFDTVRCLNDAYNKLIDLILGLRPKELILSNKKRDLDELSIKDIKNITYEYSINSFAINRFAVSLELLDKFEKEITTTTDKIYRSLDAYYKKLLYRHSVEGMKIFGDAVLTDIAILIYKNIDSHGEIADGKTPDTVSAYTSRKAEILVGAIQEKSIQGFYQNTSKLIGFLVGNLKAFKNSADNLKLLFSQQLSEYKLLLDEYNDWSTKFAYDDLDVINGNIMYERTLTAIGDVNPTNVSYHENNKLLTPEEKFNIKFRDETIETIVKILSKSNFSTQEIVEYVLKRKYELKDFFQNENSFYVTKIGGGNPFTGEAPGGLEILPGQRPNANLDEVVGSGFDEVKQFLKSVENSVTWHNLFLATSPSKTTDKSNVLLVGPMGCLDEDTFIRYEIREKNGKRINHKGGTIKRLYQRFNNLSQTHGGPKQKQDVLYFAPSINNENKIIQNQIVNVLFSGKKECFEVMTSGGERIIATEDHEFFIGNGYIKLNNLKIGDYLFVHRELNIHHKDENVFNNEINNLEIVKCEEHSRKHVIKNNFNNIRFSLIKDKIISITSVGVRNTYDIQMSYPFHNCVANGIVVHNCGKTEVFRAVGSDKKSISISVQGSDFNTCWKGEMEKNPKRLFEGAINLHKESKRHVHILIDEIDSVLNNDKGYGETNLTLEFQILMDGVVHYPNISIWGATNNPERIPMPMVRRFSKVVIVGELDQNDRIILLKQYAGYLPLNTFNDRDWENAAERLSGATGDVIRKIIDHIWRNKLTQFVSKNPVEASRLNDTMFAGKQLNIKEYSKKDRDTLNRWLGNHFKVQPRDIQKSIDLHLNNVAIQAEIETAKRTYANAKAFLHQVNVSKIII